ncbi:MAG: NAD(P)-dependent oxidoreductase [Acetobacteraceae bacterium]|nr:NAD(P)-dependent oxidoreductase [Acetobacteraceae bacterium]
MFLGHGSMRILLTGGTGFLGRAFVRANAERFSIVTLGRSPVPGATEHIAANLASPAENSGLLTDARLGSGFDAFVHLAVSPFHREFPDRALDQFNVNLAAVAALLDIARNCGVRRFVLGSTGTVYHPFRDPPFREDSFCAPDSYLGFTKLAAENVSLLYAKYFDVFIPRFFTPYGPGQQDRLISSMINRICSGEPVSLPEIGDGLVTTPVFVEDAVRALEQAVAHGWSGLMNIGGPERLSLAEMATMIGEVVGRPPAFVRASNASGARLIPDLGRLHAHLAPDSFVSFKEGIRRTLVNSC